MGGSELITLASIASGLLFPFVIVACTYLVLRIWRATFPCDGLGKARATLNRRLAQGDITIEEFYERESALRS